MSLYRWSLPTRGLICDTTYEDEPSSRPKFPTIHVGQPSQRQRQSLSTSFNTLFEKPENSRDDVKSEDYFLAPTGPTGLAPRSENMLPSSRNSAEPIRGEKDGFITQPVRPLQQKSSNQSVLPRIETPKVRSFSLSSSETNDTGNQGELPPLEPIVSVETQELNVIRPVRSTSSSYPSEGMRSPVAGDQSPAYPGSADKIMVEYGLSGEHPRCVDTTTTEATADNSPPVEDDALPTNDKRASGVATTVTNASVKSRVALLRDTLQGTIPQGSSIRPRRARGWPALRAFQDGRKHHHPSSTSDMTVPILENEGSTSSELEVSFVTYNRRQFRSVSEDCIWYKAGKTVPTYQLRPNTAAEGSTMTEIRNANSSDTADIWPERRDSKAQEETGRRPSTWMQLFTSPSRQSYSRTEHRQPTHGFSFIDWVKGVYIRTRSRFESAVKSEPAQPPPPPPPPTPAKPERVAMAGYGRATRTPIRQAQKREKKMFKVKKWRASKAICKAAKRSRLQKKTAGSAGGSLSTRKCLQLSLGDSDTVGTDSSLRRSQSCPAEVGF